MSKEKTLYVVTQVRERLSLNVMGIKTKLDLTWADGMVGAMPVFDSLEAAEKYANVKADILAFKGEVE